MSDVHGAPDDEAPDPAAVSTVKDLAVALRQLKVYAGRPSVRDIARRTGRAGQGIPSSTVQDALTGNRGLPSHKVVLAIVEALGVTDAAPWRAAWNRAALKHDGLPPVVVPPAVPPAPTTRAVVDVSRIATANEETAARMIEAADVEEATHVLARMGNHLAAPRLNLTAPKRVALILAAMDERAAASIAEAMKPTVVAAAFEDMPPAAAAHVLARIPLAHQAARLTPLDSATAAAILQQVANWPGRLGGMQKLAVPDLVRFLAAMPPGSIATFFEHPNNHARGAGIIAAVSSEDAALIIRQVPHHRVAAWLAALQPDQVAATVRDLRDDEIVSILQDMPLDVVNDRGSAFVAAFVAAFGEARLVQLLAQLPRPYIGQWLTRLRGHLTTASVNQLTRTMHQAVR